MAGWVKAAARADVPDRGLVGVQVAGEKICLVSTGDGGLYALKDRCSHADFPLSDGEIMSDDRRLECKYHGAKFDIASGRAVALPAIRPVKTYPVKVEGEDVLVELG